MSKALSLDASRALKVESRNVGAWPSNRLGTGRANVLNVPNAPTPQPMRSLPAPIQQAVARGVGQVDVMPPMPPGCCVFPSSMKYIAGSITLLTATSGTISLDSPGMFCPMKMFVFASVDLADVRISSIKAGIRNQILTGTVDALAFSTGNTCCPIACLDCLCMPGVDLDVTVINDDAMTQTITVVLVGCYVDACPPGGMSVQAPSMPSVPGCPAPGADKLVGFDSVTDVAASSTFTFEIETPGRFCPRQMLLFMETTFTDVTVTRIQSGIEDQIISGALPAILWSIDNECCILSCFKCLCAPGVPLFIDIHTVTSQRIRGMLVGTYTDAC